MAALGGATEAVEVHRLDRLAVGVMLGGYDAVLVVAVLRLAVHELAVDHVVGAVLVRHAVVPVAVVVGVDEALVELGSGVVGHAWTSSSRRGVGVAAASAAAVGVGSAGTGSSPSSWATSSR
ncbi:hypothetical protein C8E86_8352 [Catellatospora citrea]|nr:hypothetical protein C8E86_8352 [Catellatospora citrea]